MTGRVAPLRHAYAQALRASVGVNASAYGYSVMITVSFAMLAGALGSPDRLDGFLFVFGAAASFASMEFIATRRFHKAGPRRASQRGGARQRAEEHEGVESEGS